MPFLPAGVGAAVAGGVAAAGAGALATSLLSPSTSGGLSAGGGGPGSYYVPTGLSTADQQWQSLQNQNIGIYNDPTNNLSGYGQQSLNQGLGVNNALSPFYQAQANQAGGQYSTLGQQLAGASGNQFAAGNQLYQTAFDPQSALYNRSVQQLQDQTGATNSMYGLGSSAAGAGVANQALGNFNIDWQNQQLQRQLQGVQGAGQAYGQGGALGQAGAGATLQGGQLPYQTAQGIAAQPGALGNTYGQYLNQNVYGPAQSFQNQFIPYANYGQGAQAIPYQNQTQGAGAAGALVSQGISGLANNPNVQQGIAGLFGGSSAGGSFSGGDFSGAFSSSPYYSGGGNSYGFTS